jgi:hypothetical protein
MVPGEVERVAFQLWPIAALIPEGSSSWPPHFMNRVDGGDSCRYFAFMDGFKLLVVAAIGLAGCDGAKHEGLSADVTGAAATDVDEPDASPPVDDAGPPTDDACPATLLVDESDIAAIRALTSDATHLYYVLWPCDLEECPPDPHEVRAVPKAGGAPTILALEPGFISEDLAVAGGHVYWIRSSDRAIMRVPIDGCDEAEVVHQGSAPAAFLAANADGVYWRSLDENGQWTRLERLPLAGGDVETVAILPPDTTFSLLDDERLYFLSGSAPSAALLYALDLDTGETQPLTANPEAFLGGEFTQDAVALQWAADGLRRLAKSGGEPVTIADEGGYDVGSNGELSLYYDFEVEDLRAVPVTGGAPTVVAPPTCNLFGTWLERVVDADQLYWASGHDIFAVPLAP